MHSNCCTGSAKNSSRETARTRTVDAWAVRGDKGIGVIVANFALPCHPVNNETVEVVLDHYRESARAWLRQIDARHANAPAAWQRMHRPQFPSAAQVKRLDRVSEIVAKPLRARATRSELAVGVTVPPQGIAAIDVKPSRAGGN